MKKKIENFIEPSWTLHSIIAAYQESTVTCDWESDFDSFRDE